MKKNGVHKVDGAARKEVPTPEDGLFTILVVDGVADEPGLFMDFLKSEGHFVIRAESAKDALEKTRKYQPDMILLGCDMGEESCLELLPKLLILKPETAVLMLASHPTTPEIVKAMKLGAVDFLDLPVDFKKVKTAIALQKDLFK